MGSSGASSGGGGTTYPLAAGDNYTAPTGGIENFPRVAAGTNGTPGSGTLYLCAIGLPTAYSVGHISFTSSGAGATLTHWWFGLYDNNLNQLAVTADQLSAAWAASTEQKLAVATTAAGAATTFTTTYTGLYYLGIMVAASTRPSLMAAGMLSNVGGLVAAPILAGPSDSAQTTPPAFPHQAGAVSAVGQAWIPYCYVTG